MATKGKATTRKRTAPKDLTAKDGKAVQGGLTRARPAATSRTT